MAAPKTNERKASRASTVDSRKRAGPVFEKLVAVSVRSIEFRLERGPEPGRVRTKMDYKLESLILAQSER